VAFKKIPFTDLLQNSIKLKYIRGLKRANNPAKSILFELKKDPPLSHEVPKINFDKFIHKKLSKLEFEESSHCISFPMQGSFVSSFISPSKEIVSKKVNLFHTGNAKPLKK
jgi:hypothetical protein